MLKFMLLGYQPMTGCDLKVYMQWLDEMISMIEDEFEITHTR